MKSLPPILLLVAAGPALAQPFTVEWSTHDSGGGLSIAAGAYSLDGTIGQPDAGILLAASYECQGGFWSTDEASPPTPCYANCDESSGSPVLTANDFACFLNRFANALPYANCDQSAGSPTLTANDFLCFLNAYASGCS